MAVVTLKCFACGAELSFSAAISRREECPQCRADVRCCRNCKFYDAKVYNECRETSADVVRDKDRANLCDYFQPGSQAGGDTSRDALRAAAEALFKKS